MLDILNDTYFGNVYSVNKLHTLFKQLAEKNKESNSLDNNVPDLGAPPKAPDAPEKPETMIKTTKEEKPKEGTSGEPAPVTDQTVPIKMIKSLIKLLTKDSVEAEGEQSAFAGEAEFVSAPYTTKQLQ